MLIKHDDVQMFVLDMHKNLATRFISIEELDRLEKADATLLITGK